MKRILTALILLAAATNMYAGSYNAISVQGQLALPATPISNVSVWIRSSGPSGQIVGTATEISLIPDAEGVFSTQTYLSTPWIFQTGSDFVMQLTSSTGEVLSTFSITAVPFALTMRGDAQTGNQNIFGAYGNIGIGTGTPLYRLEVSSAAGSAEDIVVISTGGSPVIKMTGAGVIRANKYYGDGSSLSGIVSTGDNLGDHTARQNLDMAKFDILNVSTASFTGYINVTSNAGYEQGGATILTSPGYSDLFLGYQAGYSDNVNYSNYNTMIGFLAGNRDTGGIDNSFIGSQAGYSNALGGNNSFVGYSAGYSNTDGSKNTFVGDSAGYANTTGYQNSFFGAGAGNGGNGDNNNTFLGYSAGGANFGSNNTYVGASACGGGTGGNNNSVLGYQAGYNTGSGNNNIYIGYKAGYSNTSVSNSIIIGYNQTSSGSSTLNIGGVLYGDLLNKTIGISKIIPEAALDVVSTGAVNNQFAQIWRDSNGVIKSSISATGVMMASKFVGDGSGLMGIPSSADNLGNHTATQALNLANNQILNVSSLTVIGKDASGYSLWLSSGINMPSGTVTAGLFNGNGAMLTALNASSLASGTVADVRLSSNIDLLNANQTVAGVKTFTSSVTVTANAFSVGNTALAVVNGKVGISSAAPTSQLSVQGDVNISGDYLINGKPNNIGMVAFFASSGTCPTGWVPADGKSYTTAAYPNLFAATGYVYGGSGSNFNVPDLRGMFMRGWNYGSNGSTTVSTDTGRGFGTTQSDAFQGHIHGVPLGGDGFTAGHMPQRTANYNDNAQTNGAASDGVNGSPRIAKETRPTNIALMPCVKY